MLLLTKTSFSFYSKRVVMYDHHCFLWLPLFCLLYLAEALPASWWIFIIQQFPTNFEMNELGDIRLWMSTSWVRQGTRQLDINVSPPSWLKLIYTASYGCLPTVLNILWCDSVWLDLNSFGLEQFSCSVYSTELGIITAPFWLIHNNDLLLPWKFS